MLIGLGIDLVDIARVERMLAKHGARATHRLCTDGERAHAEVRAEPARHYAARIAAKEATFKALSSHPQAREIGWREMEVVSSPSGAPSLALHGLAARCAAELGVVRAWITLTHSDSAAAAVVVMEGASDARSKSG
jgi:holo-[acyl-carrier protein] synthase